MVSREANEGDGPHQAHPAAPLGDALTGTSQEGFQAASDPTTAVSCEGL